ncbi:MAG: hypothetical protein J0H42_20480 [Rhizobiales bacterium]|nr:hypothetical protein [Hyphomicrobiales bacterium]
MASHYRAKKRDDHLPPIDLHDLGPKRQKLIRKILSSCDGRRAFEVLEDLYERAEIGSPPPYLAIRPAEEGRQAMVIVRHSGTEDEKSTGVAAAGLENPLDSPEAVAFFENYCADLLFRLHARLDPATIRFSTVIRMYLERVRPGNVIPGNEELARLEARSHGERDPMRSYKDHCHTAVEILKFVTDDRLGSLNANFGIDYKKFAQSKPKHGAREGGGKVDGPSDTTVLLRLSFMRLVFDWFRREFRPPFRVEFETPEATPGETADLVWEEVQRAILHCLGYVWDGIGFVTHWVMHDGEWRLEFVRIGGRDAALWAQHVAAHAAVIRLLLVYWLTGTRLHTILKLGWRPMTWRGWIDVARQWIHRNGRKSPNYFKKPRENSPMLPCVAELFARWSLEDEREAANERWPLRMDGGAYVVHNGRGGPAEGVVELARGALGIVGVDARLHDLKGGGVTAYWHAGFGLGQIALYFGNREDSIDRAYRSLKNSEEAVKRPRADPETITLERLVDPGKKLPAIPRSDPPPPAGAVVKGADRLVRGELEAAISKVLHG